MSTGSCPWIMRSPWGTPIYDMLVLVGTSLVVSIVRLIKLQRLFVERVGTIRR